MKIPTFYPDYRERSVYDIDFSELWDRGYRGIIFDIDNTLVPHDADADKKIEDLFQKLSDMGFQTCLISNNKEERVKRFNRNIKTHAIFKANKPGKKSYEKALSLMGTEKRHTITVGDQLFTDIWGSRRAGLKCILLDPIDKKEEIQIVFKRYLEKLVLFIYEKCHTGRKLKEQK